MDEEVHPEMDVYVEDQEAKVLVEEILSATERDILHRIKITPFGAASVGKALGQMVAENRFSRPTLVVLDGDQDPAAGCHLLPGDDAPERQVFEALESVGWIDVAGRLNRSHSLLVDQCAQAMTLPDHHEWVGSVADALVLGRLELWRSMCITYVNSCLNEQDRRRLPDEIGDVLDA